MASPPFDINITQPADDDDVSQHPAAARTFRDVVESWLLIDHNNMGRHNWAQFDFQVDDEDMENDTAASVTRVWASDDDADEDGRLKMSRAGEAAEYVQCPPGTVVGLGTTTIPEGWLRCNGQAVSRTTFAHLFDIIGTTFGSGNGSTTYNVPNLTNLATNVIYIIKT